MTASLARHNHPMRDVVEITPLSEWIIGRLRCAGYCVDKQATATCTLPSNHSGAHEYREEIGVCVDYIRGRI